MYKQMYTVTIYARCRGEEMIKTILMDLPCSIGAFTVEQDGFYTIVINARSSYEQQRQSEIHEREHIARGDFEYAIGADAIEGMRHES